MNLGILLTKELEAMAVCDEYLENQPQEFNLNIPFGNVAFIYEKYWETSENYIPSKTPNHKICQETSNNKDKKIINFAKRKSHPGLSLSSEVPMLAFGTSQLNYRDKNDKNLFFVNRNQCEILSKNMLFLLNVRIPANITMIDDSQTGFAKICDEKLKELKERKNDGYC